MFILQFSTKAEGRIEIEGRMGEKVKGFKKYKLLVIKSVTGM